VLAESLSTAGVDTIATRFDGDATARRLAERFAQVRDA
jgi:hypothetical protein